MPILTVSDPGVPPVLRGPVLVDAQGRPRYWPTVDAYLLHGQLRPSTSSGWLIANATARANEDAGIA